MATKTAVQILAGYFNVGDGKRPAGTFRRELMEFTPDERANLARQVAAVTGDTLKTE